MTLDIAKLKAAAEKAKAAVSDYQSGVIDAGVFFRRAAEFHRLTDSPEQTLELIAQNDALVAAHVNLQRLAEVYRQAYEEARARCAELEAREIKPANREVLVTVSGYTGCGKSAIAGEIEIALRAIGVPVEWAGGDAEKRLTGADWLTAIEMYKPSVKIIEVNVPRAAGINL